MKSAPLGSALLALVIAASASAVTMDWTPIGNPGNACDPQPQGCFGAVGYAYSIGTYAVTNAQYAEFLNEKAASDPHNLYTTSMAEPAFLGGITRSGALGSYTYRAIAGRADLPVNFVSFYDALRFANWMNNGQGNGETETGAYTLLGDDSLTVTRNADANIFLPSENEWYKAAYFDPSSASYFDYPAASNTPTTCAAPGPTPNTANCRGADLTAVGSYSGSASPYGTFDQGGNVWEWNETIDRSSGFLFRGLRGGRFDDAATLFAASFRNSDGPQNEGPIAGFRVAMIPEPGTGLLVIAGLLGLAGWHRSH